MFISLSIFLICLIVFIMSVVVLCQEKTYVSKFLDFWMFIFVMSAVGGITMFLYMIAG
jgi:hypothetical protein